MCCTTKATCIRTHHLINLTQVALIVALVTDRVGGGGCSFMLLVHSTPTYTDASPDLLQLEQVVLLLPSTGTCILHLHTWWWSPTTTCAGGVIYSFQALEQKCHLHWVVVVGISTEPANQSALVISDVHCVTNNGGTQGSSCTMSKQLVAHSSGP